MFLKLGADYAQQTRSLLIRCKL